MVNARVRCDDVLLCDRKLPCGDPEPELPADYRTTCHESQG